MDMNSVRLQSLKQFSIVAGSVVLFAACADQTPVAPNRQAGNVPQFSAGPEETGSIFATLRRVTARYHDLDVAKSDGFVLLHECETRPAEGPVGVVYVNFARLLDGNINPELPDALIYEPGPNGLKLAGVEFAVPNTGQPAPQFLGTTFQREDEFGVYALHAAAQQSECSSRDEPQVSCGNRPRPRLQQRFSKMLNATSAGRIAAPS
jgi:hypothetical protein